MPQEPEAQDTRHVDRLIQRQEVLTAQSDAKTVADCAMEVSYVMQLSQALLEAGDIIEESTTARHRYLDVQREHEEGLEQQGGSKRRALVRRVRVPRLTSNNGVGSARELYTPGHWISALCLQG